MPYSDEKEHSPSEFYCPGATNGSNATFQGEDNAKQNNKSVKFPTKGLCSKRRICFYRLGSELNFCSLLIFLSATVHIHRLLQATVVLTMFF